MVRARGECSERVERPATRRHQHYKPAVETPLDNTTTSGSSDMRKVMDEIKRKLITGRNFDKVVVAA